MRPNPAYQSALESCDAIVDRKNALLADLRRDLIQNDLDLMEPIERLRRPFELEPS